MPRTQVQNQAKAVLESPKASTLKPEIKSGFKQIALGLGFTEDTAIVGPGYNFREILVVLPPKLVPS